MVDRFTGGSVDDSWTTGFAAGDVDDLYIAHGVEALLLITVSNVV